MNMLELNQISKMLVNENIESILEKLHCTVLFTSSYVIKIFPENSLKYDAEILYNEYLWDKQMPYLSAELVENIIFDGFNINVLTLKRLPLYTNILYKLIHDDLSNEKIVLIGDLINNLIYTLPSIEITPKELYKNYISNLNLQITELNDKLSLELISLLNEICNSRVILNLFEMKMESEKAVLVHGNLFSGNMFYYRNKLIVIDPISYNHIARKSFSNMDLATFLVDIRIFKTDEDFSNIFNRMTSKMKDYDIIITQLYLVLKLLVRLRFAYIESNFRDEYYDFNINEIIIIKCKKMILEETKNLIIRLNDLLSS